MMAENEKAYKFCMPCKYAYKRKEDTDTIYCSAPKLFCPFKNENGSTVRLVKVDDDMKDYEEMFVGDIRQSPELIQCRDCKHNPKLSWTGCPMAGSESRNDESFCSWAERRGEE